MYISLGGFKYFGQGHSCICNLMIVGGTTPAVYYGSGDFRTTIESRLLRKNLVGVVHKPADSKSYTLEVLTTLDL